MWLRCQAREPPQLFPALPPRWQSSASQLTPWDGETTDEPLRNPLSPRNPTIRPSLRAAWVAAPIIIGILLLLGTCGVLFFVIHRERKGQPVFTKLEGDGTRRANLHEFAAAEEGQKIPEVQRYAPATPRTAQGA